MIVVVTEVEIVEIEGDMGMIPGASAAVATRGGVTAQSKYVIGCSRAAFNWEFAKYHGSNKRSSIN